MNQANTSSVSLNATALTGGQAVLVLDAHGRIELASPGAASLWQAKPAELAGDHLPNLFAFDVTSRDADWLQAQWEVLLAAALPQSIPLKLQPKEAAAFDALLRLEPASAEPARYFAFLSRPAPAAAPAAVPGTASAEESSLIAALNDRSPLGFFDLNFVKQEVYYSPAWKRMLGYTDSSLANTYDTWLALIHPEDSAAAPDKLASRAGATTGSRSFSVEYRMKHARGHYVWVQGVGVQLHGPNGALQRVVGAHLDIHDRKEFEETSLHAEERMLLLSERGRVAVFDLDFTDNHSWLSPAFKAMLGYAETELPDSPDSFLRALPATETTGGLAAYFLKPFPGQAVYYDTLQLTHRNGSSLWVYAGVVRVISRKRELQRVIGFAAPMPEGLAAASGLPADQLAIALDELHEGVLLADSHANVIHANTVAQRLLGREAGQLVGQSVVDVFRLVHRLSHAAGENPFDRALAFGEATPLNNEFALDCGPDQKPVPVVYSCRAIADPSGTPLGAVVVFRNPDEMSLTPEELIRANRFDSLGQLAGGIAHDFNNLLTTILGGVSLAKDNRDYSGLENSERACLAAKGLSKQLLAFAKGGTATRQVVKPGELLTDAVRLSAAGSAVKVELNSPADLGTVEVDRAQMLQVFQNLVINAIQAMPTGQGNIWVTAGNVALTEGQIPPLAAGQYMAVEVRDNGCGIKAEHLQRIFDPFFTTKKTGTGLGLATVLSIIKRHGGQLGVDSEVGVGTTFTVFLPRVDQEAEVEARRAPSFHYANRTGRVLFMDDDPEISYLTGTMLEGLGYKYDLAKNGEEALQFYKRYLNIGRPYDAVIMDLTVIGGMGGEQCFKHLRDLDPNVRAIVASGYDNDDMARQFLDMGFCGYLTKPYRIGDLGRVIKKVLGN
ncbi:MAG: PAS domain-containing protein [Opitutae bacterium]|nr:PAS domain-containing protein [Opitutae bacterium]